MTPAMQLKHTQALTALNAAKAIKAGNGESPYSVWAADHKASFDAAMADFKAANAELNTLKADAEQFSVLNAGLEAYTAPQGGFYGNPMGLERNAAPRGRQTPEQRIAAKSRHMDAFKRFVVGGSSALQAVEQAAYLSGARQMFGDNPSEALSTLLPQEQFALVGNVDSLGGFLVPEDFMTDLIKELAGFTVIRPLARVRPTSRQAASYLVVAGSGNAQYSSGMTGAWRGEGWTTDQALLPTQNQPRFGRERVPVHIWCPDVIEITMELMEDSAINLDSEVRSLLAETRAMDEDSAFLLGTGIGTPKGIITEASEGNIANVNSGVANGQTYAGLVDLFTALPAQYRQRATFAMNSYTLGLLMQLEDTEGHNIFPTNTIPTNLFGRPIVVSEFIADGGTDGNFSMIFGDFSYYAIADRMDMRIIRLVERFAPNVGIMAVARVGGQVLKTAPFRVQEVGA